MNRFTILIVDDTLSCRESVAAMLRRSGYRVICAENSRRALDVLENNTPDLMLLDLAMPDASGPEFLEAVRQDLRWRDLPVILFTGSGDVMELAKDVGVRDCLVAVMPVQNRAVDPRSGHAVPPGIHGATGMRVP